MIRQKTDRRKYIRIPTVLPVEFVVLDENGKKATPWLQGFTSDICKGGLCLLINDLWWGFWDRFNYRDARLLLKIDLPFKQKDISTKARVIWVTREQAKEFNKYMVGVEFLGSGKSTQGLFKYALWMKFLPMAIAGIIIILSALSFSLFRQKNSLVEKNRKLVADYVSVLQKSSSLEDSLAEEKQFDEFFRKRQEDLQEEISRLEKKVVQWKDDYVQLQATRKQDEKSLAKAEQLKEKISSLEEELASLKRENVFLKTKQKQREAEAIRIRQEVKGLEKEKRLFSKKVIDGMYSWIKNRQDLISGLVISYEGDHSLKEMCFTYDQSLAAVVFLVFDDLSGAERILDFYLKEAKTKKKIYNAYYTRGAVAEYVAHSGPNAWIGIAALNHMKKTGSKKYLPIAKVVDGFLRSMMDREGGIKGGPTVTWYATEHNLDAVAFYNLFYEVTGHKRYRDLAEKVKSWIAQYSYTSYSVPVKRGKGDSTIATDTYAWSVSAFGPQELFDMNMNPDSIMEFAVENCEVCVTFRRKEGDVKLKGFDFAKFRNSCRGGVVSGEWTSQMILAFEIMADFYKEKDAEKYEQYLEKAMFYFEELQKMLITSPSRVGREDPCLPYASKASVDTGHGWRTPKGNKTGSLASTAYFLLAYSGYNPLSGESLSLSIKEGYEQRLSEVAANLNQN